MIGGEEMDELYHHGVLGQKWGVRRYQNPDGSLTSAGKRHYTKDLKKLETIQKKYDSAEKKYITRLTKFHKVSKKPTLSDFSLSAKHRSGIKLGKAYKNMSKRSKEYMKQLYNIGSRYGIKNFSVEQYLTGLEYVTKYLNS